MTSETLESCPFCGGEAEPFNPFGETDGTWTVLCGECAASVGFEQTEAEAIAAWNARVERTCRIEDRYYDELWEATCTRLSCGHDVWSEVRNYCPECGAKVVK